MSEDMQLDPEIEAIANCVDALEPMAPSARMRVLAYMLSREDMMRMSACAYDEAAARRLIEEPSPSAAPVAEEEK